ncbi:hypothetical protein HPP92_020724 [Vanilla planifolia]|uniref:F-box domain-containing protein n=1 Tax=Vanilla planifolia TaxID=51239 RepID=A0A835PZN8_VANPL|nr:hypothetical protein HPP92_020724 [Vanilla planifolia]
MTPKRLTFRSKKLAIKSCNRYLKPGDLAQLRYNLSASRHCTNIGKRRVALETRKKKNVWKKRILLNAVERSNVQPIHHVGCQSGLRSSPSVVNFRSPTGPLYEFKQVKLHESPSTPCVNSECYSRLESLPIELLVKILCHLHHDQLRAVFHVSSRIRTAVMIAKQTHFNYTTPDRSRVEMLRITTPLPTQHWPFTRGEGKAIKFSSPHTPKAPKHGRRPPRLKLLDMKQVAAVLFQDSTLPSNCLMLPRLPNDVFKPLASNRALFYEDELCKAVAKNKLR